MMSLVNLNSYIGRLASTLETQLTCNWSSTFHLPLPTNTIGMENMKTLAFILNFSVLEPIPKLRQQLFGENTFVEMQSSPLSPHHSVIEYLESKTLA